MEDNIIKEFLKTKTRSLKESTINNYLINLKKLNNNKKIKDLKFLKNSVDIENKIKKYSLHTQKTYIIPILSILKCDLDSNRYLYYEYGNILDSINKRIKTNKKI